MLSVVNSRFVAVSHFAIIQEDDADQHDAPGPDAGECASCVIFRGEAELEPARPPGGNSENRERDVAELGEHFFFDVAKAVGMREQKSAGNSDEQGKNQADIRGADAARLDAPFECGERDDQQREDAVEEHFWIRKGCPKTVRPERPDFGIAAQEKENG